MANPFLIIGSVAVSAVVVGVGLLAVPGWIGAANDSAAKSDLASIRGAQSAALVHPDYGAYTDDVDLLTSGELGASFQQSSGVRLAELDSDGDTWCAVTESKTGAFFATGSEAAMILERDSLAAARDAVCAGPEVPPDTPGQGGRLVFTVDTYAPGCTTPGFTFDDLASPDVAGVTGREITGIDGTPDATIGWGDGNTVQAVQGHNGHDYARGGVYEVVIEGTVPSFGLPEQGAAACITEMTEWGDVGQQSASFMFTFASNIKRVPTPPAGITHWIGTFYGAAQDVTSPWGKWDMSSATDVTLMFAGQVAFNGDISSWDVGAVERFDMMFQQAAGFNRDISRWDTSAARSMTGMFFYARAFDQDISGWDVRGVGSFDSMFQYAVRFNQDLASWETGKATTMAYMFSRAKAQAHDLSGWDVSSVTNHEAWGQDTAMPAEPAWPR